MKAVVATEFLLLVAMLGVLYLVWLQQGQVAALESDVYTLRAQVSDLAKPAAAPRPRAPRTPKPKEKT